MSSSFNDEIADLRARLRTLEDRAEIEALIASYGPAVDSGNAEGTAALWSVEGTYEFDAGGTGVTLPGREGIEAMVRSAGHEEIIMGGSGHFLSAPDIVISGDRAYAVCYSMLLRHRAPQATDAAETAAVTGTFHIDRLSANRWEFQRTEDGWSVTHRVNYLINGQQAARDLLSQPSTSRLPK